MEKKKSLGVENPVNKLVKKLQENQNSLHLSRVPIKTKREFVKLATEEFCGDYGMCLKFLMDGIINQDIRLIIEQLSDMELRLQSLEEPKENPEKENKVIKMLNGIERRIK